MNGREELAQALLEKLRFTTLVKDGDNPDIGGAPRTWSLDETIEGGDKNVAIVVAFMQSVERNIQDVCAGFAMHAAVQAHQVPTNTIKGGWYKEGAVAALKDVAQRLKTLEIEPQDTPNDRAQSGQTLLKLG